jgi:putative oxidoreductase
MIMVHLPKGFFVSKGGYEFNLAILGSVATLALTGPGAYSPDTALGIRLREPISVIVLTVLVVAGVAVALVTRAPQPADDAKPRAI